MIFNPSECGSVPALIPSVAAASTVFSVLKLSGASRGPAAYGAVAGDTRRNRDQAEEVAALNREVGESFLRIVV